MDPLNNTHDDALIGRVDAIAHAQPLVTFGNLAGKEKLEIVEKVLKIEADVADIKAGVTALAARPAADVDEAALASELAARGISGVTAAELKEILASVRLVPAQTEGGMV